MGWSFRKSTSFGPLRLNFSNSGLGFSVGVKGARVSVNKRGTYVNLGAGGMYYRQKIESNEYVDNNYIPPIPESEPSANIPHTITTGNVESVTDVDSRAFIEELESKDAKISFFKWFGLWPSIILLFYACSFSDDVVREEIKQHDVFVIDKKSVHIRNEPSKDAGSIAMAKFAERYAIAATDSSGWIKIYLDAANTKSGYIREDMGNVENVVTSSQSFTRMEDSPALPYLYILLVVTLIAWCIYLWHQDKKRKTLEIYYTLDHEIGSLHEKFLEYFREFASSRKIWQNLHATSGHDRKYNAGASTLVSRTGVKGVSLNRLPSPFLKTNISIPCITLRNTELYFFPERLIVKRRGKFGAAFYRNISIEKSDVRFIESDSVPSDATIVDYTWQYLNKSGGPDKRFNNNRQLPICLYTDYMFTSEGGLNEVITTSRNGAMDNFSRFVEAIGSFQSSLN